MPLLEHSMYPERLLEHFQNPRNVGELEPPALLVEVSNPACGDILRLSARFEGGRVVEARYKVRGCTASIAAGSALTEWMRGKRARRSPPSIRRSWTRPWAACRRIETRRRACAPTR